MRHFPIIYLFIIIIIIIIIIYFFLGGGGLNYPSWLQPWKRIE